MQDVRHQKPGTHAFAGSCAPGALNQLSGGQETFSVGIFEWLPKANGKGVKKGPVKVRLRGSMSDPDEVYSAARRVCEQLDMGTYKGPKSTWAYLLHAV